MGSARPSLPRSDLLIIRSEHHSLDLLWVEATCIEKRRAALTYRQTIDMLMASWMSHMI